MPSSHEIRPRLFLTRGLIEPAMACLASRFVLRANDVDANMPAHVILSGVTAHQADVLMVMAMDRIDAELISRLPGTVRVIATYSVGYDHIDLAAARGRGIAVLSTPDVLSTSVADMALLLILGAARRAHEGQRLLYERAWTGWTPTQLPGREVSGARIGIFGMGRIGREIARKASRGFDMAVHYHNRSRLPADLERGATFHANFWGLLAVSDFLVLAAPATRETRGLLNAAAIEKLPKGAVVVNIARGDLIDDAALISALRSGRVAAAGLDVFANEPALDTDYLTLPNVFLQPHQGSSTRETRLKMAELLADSVEAILAGQQVSNRLA